MEGNKSMNKRKSILVTVIITTMLVVIDIFLYKQSKSGFVLLTGMVTVYGYYRIAVDFCQWLCTPEKQQGQPPRFLDPERQTMGKH